MYKKKKILAVITARMGSSRLKNKMILSLGDKVVLGILFKRLMRSKLIDNFILATTTSADNDVLVSLAKSYNINVFRGSEEDVLGRIFLAVTENFPDTDVLVRACADNPLVMPTLVDDSIISLIDNNLDVITPFEINTLPFGFSMVSMTMKCLEKIYTNTKEALYREHVENFCFDNPKDFKVGYQVASLDTHYPWLYLTLDYQLDYLRILNLEEGLKNVDIKEQPKWLINKINNSGIVVNVDSFELLKSTIDILNKINIAPKYILLKLKKKYHKLQDLNDNFMELVNYANDKKINILRNISIEKAYEMYNFSCVISNKKLIDFNKLPSNLNIFYMNKRKIYSMMSFNFSSQQEYKIYSLPLRMSSYSENLAFLLFLQHSVYFATAGIPRVENQENFWIAPKEKSKKIRKVGFPDALSVFFPKIIYLNYFQKTSSKLTFMNDNLVDKLLSEISLINESLLVIVIDPFLIKNQKYIQLLEKLDRNHINYRNFEYSSSIENLNQENMRNLFEELTLMSNGDFIQMNNDNNKLVLGNYRYTSISEVWRTELTESIRINSLEKIGVICQVQN